MIVRCLTLTLLATAALAATADAQQYDVLGCRAPDGGPAPTAGWAGVATPGAAAADGCAAGGALAAELAGAPAGGTSAAWRFAAPEGTRIVRLRAARTTSGVVRGTRAADLQYALTLDGRTLEACAVSDTSPCTADLTGEVVKEGLDGREAEFRLTCQAGGDQRCSGPLRLDVTRVVTTLRDAAAPAVSGLRTLDDGDRSGVLRLVHDATDAGGGLWRQVVRVDGQVVSATPLGAAPCTDVSPEEGGQFAAPVPCPAAVTGVVAAIAAKDLPPGPHTVELAVQDAAGNATTVATTEFPRLNADRGAVQGSAGLQALLHGQVRARFVQTGTTRLRARYGRRHVVRGDVRTRDGRPVVGARLDVVHVLPGGRRLVKTGLRTRAGGAFTLILPMDLRSRRIEIAFRAVRPGPVTARRTLQLTVAR